MGNVKTVVNPIKCSNQNQYHVCQYRVAVAAQLFLFLTPLSCVRPFCYDIMLLKVIYELMDAAGIVDAIPEPII